MRTIWVTWSFIGFHRYPTAPIEVSYLSSPHRHTFNVRVELEVVQDQDRELEFHMVRSDLIRKFTPLCNDQDTGSCEQMCNLLEGIISTYYPGRQYRITVDEDKEAGSTLQSETY